MSPCSRRIRSILTASNFRLPSIVRYDLASRFYGTISQRTFLSTRRPWNKSSLGRPIVVCQRWPRFSSTIELKSSSEPLSDALPICCPGCGAYAQTVKPNEPGYYGKQLKRTRELATEQKKAASPERRPLDEGSERNTSNGQDVEHSQPPRPVPEQGDSILVGGTTHGTVNEGTGSPVHVCDRCHDLIHHNRAAPAPTPSIYSIQAYLDESPHKHNHIYHILDAADFPMSLVPNIYDALEIQEQRSRNRRAKTEKYKAGRRMPTVTFVITRSDLLAATKEQADSKMEYMRTVLRQALEKSQDTNFRLGNVHMISANRGWWTRNVKDEIRELGGGVWIVGKANVGKSSFIEACFPKNSRNLDDVEELVRIREQEEELSSQPPESLLLPENRLLPPAPREDLYPILPVTSSLPGTTAGPIRLPFGRGKGEIIDLPGLDRADLGKYVRDEHTRDLIMTKRGNPTRHTIKPGQSLLLGGGLVRITPAHPEAVVMAACFVPLEAHVTKTAKAVEMQTQQRAYPGAQNILKDGVGEAMSSAGKFALKWDVTKSHLPLSLKKRMEDKGVLPPRLPYKVMSADILIEGCGWVELTTQIRTRPNLAFQSVDGAEMYPQIEVFSPKGEHIGFRMPIECWNFIAQKQVSDKRRRSFRGRQNIGLTKRAAHGSTVWTS